MLLEYTLKKTGYIDTGGVERGSKFNMNCGDYSRNATTSGYSRKIYGCKMRRGATGEGYKTCV